MSRVLRRGVDGVSVESRGDDERGRGLSAVDGVVVLGPEGASDGDAVPGGVVADERGGAIESRGVATDERSESMKMDTPVEVSVEPVAQPFDGVAGRRVLRRGEVSAVPGVVDPVVVCGPEVRGDADRGDAVGESAGVATDEGGESEPWSGEGREGVAAESRSVATDERSESMKMDTPVEAPVEVEGPGAGSQEEPSREASEAGREETRSAARPRRSAQELTEDAKLRAKKPGRKTYKRGKSRTVRENTRDIAAGRKRANRKKILWEDALPAGTKVAEKERRRLTDEGGIVLNSRDREYLMLLGAHGWLEYAQYCAYFGVTKPVVSQRVGLLSKFGLLKNNTLSLTGSVIATTTRFGAEHCGMRIGAGYKSIVPKANTVLHAEAVFVAGHHLERILPAQSGMFGGLFSDDVAVFMTEREREAAVGSGEISPRVLSIAPWLGELGNVRDVWRFPVAAGSSGVGDRAGFLSPDGLLFQPGRPPVVVEVELTAKTKPAVYERLMRGYDAAYRNGLISGVLYVTADGFKNGSEIRAVLTRGRVDAAATFPLMIYGLKSDGGRPRIDLDEGVWVSAAEYNNWIESPSQRKEKQKDKAPYVADPAPLMTQVLGGGSGLVRPVQE